MEPLKCPACGYVGFNEGDDGFFYCDNCNHQGAEPIGDDGEDNVLNETGMYSQKRPGAAALTLSQPEPEYGLLKTMNHDDDVKLADSVGPSGPTDFGWAVSGSYESYYSAIRARYVLGFQIMLQNQSKALVNHFNVSQNILHLHNPIWLRLLACTGVMADDWADKILNQSELRNLGDMTESQRSARYIEEPQNMFGQRAVMIWYRSLRSCLPISYTLALSFLFCHVAEEPILPTDILKGVLEGKIPYFSAFVDIEKQLGPPAPSFPISCSFMFRPTQVISLQKLEATAACISEKIGLELRPLNFNSLATRYIEDLGLSVPKIVPLASRIYEWSMPRGIYLSSNELKLPSRVCLMSILVVVVRLYYNINGFGKWESTMSNSSNSLPPDKLSGKEKHTVEFDIAPDASDEGFIPDISSKNYEGHESDVVELFHTLDAKFNKLRELHDTFGDSLPPDKLSGKEKHTVEFDNGTDAPEQGYIPDVTSKDYEVHDSDVVELFRTLDGKFNKLCELHDTFEHYKDLSSYLRFCKDSVFAGVDIENYDEQMMIEELWQYYLHQKESEPSQNGLIRPREDDVCTPTVTKSLQGDGDKSQFLQDKSNNCGREDIVKETPLEVSSNKKRTIRSVQRGMEENKFVYIPPRSNVKKDDYIYYSRKKSNGAYVYAVHGDYFILLRSCAKACQVDIRTMHIGVLTFERLLQEREREQVACMKQ